MPYRHAWLWLIALLAVASIAFWPGYLSRTAAAPIAWHVHAITASTWLLLLIVQSRTVHVRQLALHRTLGLATFGIVPAFTGGGALVIQSMAQATAGGDPFYRLHGLPLGAGDLVASIAFAWLVAMALKERRRVQLHARYLLATALLLSDPALGRIYDRFVPGLIIRGPQDFPLFVWAFHLAGLTGIVVALWLALRDRRHARPWITVAVALVAQSVAFVVAPAIPAWQSAFATIGTLPAPLVFAIGAAAGAMAVVAGWTTTPTRAQRVAAI